MATLTDPTGRGRKARTITATDPATGAQITRRTDRAYVAAVVTDDLKGQAYAVAWAGRPDLAAKALAQRGGAANGYRLAPVTGDPWATATPEPTPPPAARVTLPGEPPAAAPVPPAPGGGVAAHRAAAAAGRPVSLAALARDLGRGLALASGGRLPAPADRVAAQARALAADLLIPRPTPDSLRARAVIAGAEAARLAVSGEAAPAQAAASHAETLTAWADSLADRPTGDAWAGQPWDPGTPEARARVAEQGRIAARLHPIAQAATGAGCTLPPSWWSDGPALNGELAPMRALEALPLPTLAAAAAALAALPPVTEAQAQGLAYCRAALRAAAARL